MADKKSVVKKYHVAGKYSGQLTFNLMLLLKAAVPTGEALASLEETTDDKTAKKAVRQMRNDVSNGLQLWKAMERSGAISRSTITLIQIGENAGKLVENLQVAAVQEEKHRLFQSKVQSALIYPIIVLTVTVAVGLGISWFLLPKLAVTFEQLHVDLPLISRVMISFGVFLTHNGYWAVPAVIIGMFGALYFLFGFSKTRGLGQRLLLHIPGIRQLVQNVEIARFGYTLGELLGVGMSVPQALRMLQTSTSSPRYAQLYTWLAEQFDGGFSFASSFKSNKSTKKILPATVQQMVIAGERSGTLPETLQNIGKMYDERADIATDNLESTLEPLLMVFMAAGVLLVAIAVILPIYGLIGGLQQ